MVIILSTFSTIINAQSNDASLVVGLESNYLVGSTKSDSKPTIGSISGLTLQKPIGQFSVGIGVLLKDYNGLYVYREPTGKTKIRDEKVSYEFDKIIIDPEYYSFASRIYYRLPCNCVYFFGGFEVDFLRTNDLISKFENYGYTNLESIDSNYEVVPVREKVYNFNFGAGLNFPISKRLRIFSRPSVVISQKLYATKSEVPKHLKENPVFLHLSLGTEYGFGAYD